MFLMNTSGVIQKNLVWFALFAKQPQDHHGKVVMFWADLGGNLDGTRMKRGKVSLDSHLLPGKPVTKRLRHCVAGYSGPNFTHGAKQAVPFDNQGIQKNADNRRTVLPTRKAKVRQQGYGLAGYNAKQALNPNPCPGCMSWKNTPTFIRAVKTQAVGNKADGTCKSIIIHQELGILKIFLDITTGFAYTLHRFMGPITWADRSGSRLVCILDKDPRSYILQGSYSIIDRSKLRQGFKTTLPGFILRIDRNYTREVCGY